MLLIAWHSRTGAAHRMAQAAQAGAERVSREWGGPALPVLLRRAAEVDEANLREAAAYAFCAPENLGTVSGEMKEMFDRHYYALVEAVAGRPYALMIAAGTDGTGAQRQIERILTGWRLRAVAPALVARNGAQTPEAIAAPKTIAPDVRAQCEELGGMLAATVLMGRA